MQKEINVAYNTVSEAARKRRSGDYYSAMIENGSGAVGEYVAVFADNDLAAEEECIAAAEGYPATWCGAGEMAHVMSIYHHKPGAIAERIYTQG